MGKTRALDASAVLEPIPSQYVDEIEEPAARRMLEALQTEEVSIPEVGTIRSTFVGPVQNSGASKEFGPLPLLITVEKGFGPTLARTWNIVQHRK